MEGDADVYETPGEGAFEEENDGAEFVAIGGEDASHVAVEDLEAMKKKLKEMEEEAARLKAIQAAGELGAAGTSQQPPDEAAKAEADSRSIYIGNVDYSCTPEEVQQHFQGCGTVQRVTILTDKFGQAKGHAYLEFLEVDAVANAVMLDNSELHGRKIQVQRKRTNVPGMKYRGRGGFRGGYSPYSARGYYPPPFRGRGHPGFYAGYPQRGGRYAPRGRGYNPY